MLKQVSRVAEHEYSAIMIIIIHKKILKFSKGQAFIQLVRVIFMEKLFGAAGLGVMNLALKITTAVDDLEVL